MAARHDLGLSVVLPAWNEEGNILQAIDSVSAASERLYSHHQIVVVDDGSSDATAELVRARSVEDGRVQLISHGRNRGYGEALRSGFAAAKLDHVFFTDADNQFDVDELELLVRWIDHVDVVVGYRVDRQDRFMRKVNAHIWNLLVRVLFYVPVRDIDCAFKLFRRTVLDELQLEAVGAMVNTELMVKLGRAGYGVVEVPVRHLPRTVGKARGASPKVIATALYELSKMHRRLRTARAPTPRIPPSNA